MTVVLEKRTKKMEVTKRLMQKETLDEVDMEMIKDRCTLAEKDTMEFMQKFAKEYAELLDKYCEELKLVDYNALFYIKVNDREVFKSAFLPKDRREVMIKGVSDMLD
jgi:hypothetical protein